MAITVLHVLLEPRMGGPQFRILGLADGLRRRGIHTSVVLPTGDAPFRRYLIEHGHEVHQVPLHRFRWSLSPRVQLEVARRLPADIKNLVRLFRATPADIIHVHGLYQVQGAVAAGLCGIPVVWHLNDLLLPRGLVRLAAQMVTSASAAVVTVSEAVKEYAFGGFGHASRIVTIYDPPVRVKEEISGGGGIGSLPGTSPRVLTIGNLYRVKGHADLLRAVSRMTMPASFLIAGAPLATQPEVMLELERLMVELSLSQRVYFMGWQEDIAALLAACDVYVHPSHSEACPLAVLEAMAAGKPVVATRVGGVPELVIPGETGYLVPPRDPVALAAAIQALLEDPARRIAMGRNGRAVVEERFSLAQCTARHEALYRAVLAGSDVAAAVRVAH